MEALERFLAKQEEARRHELDRLDQLFGRHAEERRAERELLQQLLGQQDGRGRHKGGAGGVERPAEASPRSSSSTALMGGCCALACTTVALKEAWLADRDVRSGPDAVQSAWGSSAEQGSVAGEHRDVGGGSVGSGVQDVVTMGDGSAETSAQTESVAGCAGRLTEHFCIASDAGSALVSGHIAPSLIGFTAGTDGEAQPSDSRCASTFSSTLDCEGADLAAGSGSPGRVQQADSQHSAQDGGELAHESDDESDSDREAIGCTPSARSTGFAATVKKVLDQANSGAPAWMAETVPLVKEKAEQQPKSAMFYAMRMWMNKRATQDVDYTQRAHRLRDGNWVVSLQLLCQGFETVEGGPSSRKADAEHAAWRLALEQAADAGYVVLR